MKAYFSLVKFAHTVFALPFALMAYFLAVEAAGHHGNWHLFVLIILCMVFARSAAMSFNRYVDRRIDAQNTRTRIREIPSGVIAPASALRLTIVMSLAFMLCAYGINLLCFFLSPVALFVILGYSYTKRFTWLCHFILGLGLGLAPVGAYISVTGRFELLPIMYGVMVLLWVSGFDILYSLQDEDFDKSQNLHSVPARFGKTNAKRISQVVHLVCAMLLIGISFYQSQTIALLGYLHWAGAFGFIALLFWQHRLVWKYDLDRINQAFFQTNGLASIFFGAMVILDLVW